MAEKNNNDESLKPVCDEFVMAPSVAAQHHLLFCGAHIYLCVPTLPASRKAKTSAREREWVKSREREEHSSVASSLEDCQLWEELNRWGELTGRDVSVQQTSSELLYTFLSFGSNIVSPLDDGIDDDYGSFGAQKSSTHTHTRYSGRSPSSSRLWNSLEDERTFTRVAPVVFSRSCRSWRSSNYSSSRLWLSIGLDSQSGHRLLNRK